jgi:3-hydroxyacyl-[acyl-carrier-protein] dehydratase
MPGVLFIEALAQTGVLLVAHSYPHMVDFQKNISLFAGIEKARFRSPVRPGDKLDMECSNLVHKLQFWKMDAKAYVGGVLVADARLTAAVFPREGM